MILLDAAGAIQQEHVWRSRAIQNGQFRPIDLNQEIVDATANQRRHHVFDRADPCVAIWQPQHRGQTRIDDAVETRRNVHA